MSARSTLHPPPATDWHALHGDAFAGRTVAVTGGAGFIGSHLVAALLKLDAHVTVIDDLTGGDPRNLDLAIEGAGGDARSRLRFVNASIEDRAAVDEAFTNASVVLHQAAWGSVPRSVEMPDRYHGINVTGTLNVLEAARAAGAKRVVFAASSSAYGDTPTLPKHEDMPPRPRSPYAANKVAGEAMCRAWANSYGLDTACLRYFNIFGPRQNANSAYAAVIAAFAKALLSGDRPVIFGDGEQSRDFTYVDNAVHANLLAAAAPGPLRGEPINIACGRAVTVNELCAKMAALLVRDDLPARYHIDRPGDVKHSLADLTRAAALLDYEPLVDFDAGLAATVAWYASQ